MYKDMYMPNNNRCHQWCQHRLEHFKCYHQNLVTDELLTEMENKLSDILSGMNHDIE